MEISSFIKDELGQVQCLRGWIANAYAQIEYLLGDLIFRCREVPEYTAVIGKFSHSATTRVKQVRAMLDRPGPLDAFSAELTLLMVKFEERHAIRNLLAHGFSIYLKASGAGVITFHKFERDQARGDYRVSHAFTMQELHAETDGLVELSHHAMLLFERIHKAAKWKRSPA